MYQINKENFGAFVAALRKEKGMTQKQLAEKLYISDKAISKWETGQSIPDPALLIPLSEQLGVTVTELLLCKRSEKSEPMAPEQVEALVKTAVGCTGPKFPRAWQQKSAWHWIYPLCLLIGLLESSAYFLFDFPQTTAASVWLPTYLGLSAVFGVYFCFFAPLRLSRLYDDYAMNYFVDGVLRMHLPGMQFNNQNWPFILRAARRWSCTILVIVPPLCILSDLFLPESAAPVALSILLFLFLTSLFGSLYTAGKKHS